jgi:hypothetical protein
MRTMVVALSIVLLAGPAQAASYKGPRLGSVLPRESNGEPSSQAYRRAIGAVLRSSPKAKTWASTTVFRNEINGPGRPGSESWRHGSWVSRSGFKGLGSTSSHPGEYTYEDQQGNQATVRDHRAPASSGILKRVMTAVGRLGGPALAIDFYPGKDFDPAGSR